MASMEPSKTRLSTTFAVMDAMVSPAKELPLPTIADYSDAER